MVSTLLDNQLELIQLGRYQTQLVNFSIIFFDYCSVLPMANGVNAPTGYIINGGPPPNMSSAGTQIG